MSFQLNTYPALISSQDYVCPDPVDLVVVRRFLGDIIKDGKIFITDTNGNMVFKVIKLHSLSIRGRILLVDSVGKTVFTLRPRILTMHDRWEAYKGDSTKDADLVFTVKKSNMVQLKKKLQVFLAKNTNGYVCDYRVEGINFLQDSCTVYVGETNNIVAQMHKKLSFENLVGKETFAVTVYPNIDYAFIAALIVIGWH